MSFMLDPTSLRLVQAGYENAQRVLTHYEDTVPANQVLERALEHLEQTRSLSLSEAWVDAVRSRHSVWRTAGLEQPLILSLKDAIDAYSERRSQRDLIQYAVAESSPGLSDDESTVVAEAIEEALPAIVLFADPAAEDEDKGEVLEAIAGMENRLVRKLGPQRAMLVWTALGTIVATIVLVITLVMLPIQRDDVAADNVIQREQVELQREARDLLEDHLSSDIHREQRESAELEAERETVRALHGIDQHILELIQLIGAQEQSRESERDGGREPGR